jgi:uncharacterized membrane protein
MTHRLHVRPLPAFAAVAVAFLALDAVWLTVTATRLYRPALGALMRPDFDMLAAAAFYACYFAGLTHFVIVPSRGVREAALQGACFGFVAYATYDLTNQATLVGWHWSITAIDLAWGSFASAVACALARRVARRR